MTYMNAIILLQSGGGLGSFLPLILLLAVMYFFFFRPQIKKQKEEKKFQESIAKGMRVVTSSGIHGKILEVKEKTIVLESENTRLLVDRSTISKEMSAVYQSNEKSEKKDKDKDNKQIADKKK